VSIRLFTIGYEGKTIEQFVAELRAARIDRILDVRELPLSRRKGFSKTALRTALEAASIDYVHLRAAGNPFRRRDASLRAYGAHLDRAPEIVAEVIAAATGHRAALLCVEADAATCHRSVLSDRIARAIDVAVVDL
jgi:uncharacterized protein (DUF488 family)